MPLKESGGIGFYQFESLLQPGLYHAILTRNGGLSPEPWASLNLGSTVGDDLERVRSNKRLAFEALGLDQRSTYEVWQTHSAKVQVVDSPLTKKDFVKADAILTSTPGIILLMRFADCLPILLYDSVSHTIGIVHVGWLGTVRKTILVAVEKLIETFGVDPKNLSAGIGPSIGPDHYPVREDVISQVRNSFGEQTNLILRSDDRQTYLDLWTANQLLLEQAGVQSIEQSGICTACNIQQWYSHRGEPNGTGRFGALIVLR
jgi:YfiH family protein